MNSKCAVAYLLSGDVALKLNDVNKASSDYNQAIYLDENCSEAYFKYAQVYKGVDPQLSLDMLMRLQTKTPDDNRISKELADVYYTMGQYGKAKEAYESYLKVGTPTEQDYTRYAMLLYLNKDYAQSSDMAKKGLELAPENHVLKRLAMYDNLELKDYKEGLKQLPLSFLIPVIRIMYIWITFISPVCWKLTSSMMKRWHSSTKHCPWTNRIRKSIKISLMYTKRNVIFRRQ